MICIKLLSSLVYTHTYIRICYNTYVCIGIMYVCTCVLKALSETTCCIDTYVGCWQGNRHKKYFSEGDFDPISLPSHSRPLPFIPLPLSSTPAPPLPQAVPVVQAGSTSLTSYQHPRLRGQDQVRQHVLLSGVDHRQPQTDH